MKFEDYIEENKDALNHSADKTKMWESIVSNTAVKTRPKRTLLISLISKVAAISLVVLGAFYLTKEYK